MFKANHVRMIQIKALSEVESGTLGAWYRSVCRWYSKEFSTSLKDVLDMAEEEVLSVYYEDKLWSLKTSTEDNADQLYEDVKQGIIITEEEIEARNLEDDEWANDLINQIERDKTKDASEKEREMETAFGHLKNPNLEEDSEYSFSDADFDDKLPEDFLD